MTQELMTNEAPEAVAEREQASAAQMLQLAQAYEIDCPELAEAAAEDLGQIKARLKALDETRLAMTRPLDEAKRRIMDLFAKPREVLESAETKLKAALVAWNQREQARLEKERREQEAALQAQAEAMRQQQQAAEQEAAKAAETGDTEAAQQFELEASAIAQTADLVASMAPSTVAAPAKLSGVSQRMDYKAEVVDLLALVKAVAAGEASIELLEANTKEIGKRAKALKLEFKVPGVRVYAVPVISARAK